MPPVHREWRIRRNPIADNMLPFSPVGQRLQPAVAGALVRAQFPAQGHRRRRRQRGHARLKPRFGHAGLTRLRIDVEWRGKRQQRQRRSGAVAGPPPLDDPPDPFRKVAPLQPVPARPVRRQFFETAVKCDGPGKARLRPGYLRAPIDANPLPHVRKLHCIAGASPVDRCMANTEHRGDDSQPRVGETLSGGPLLIRSRLRPQPEPERQSRAIHLPAAAMSFHSTRDNCQREYAQRLDSTSMQCGSVPTWQRRSRIRLRLALANELFRLAATANFAAVAFCRDTLRLPNNRCQRKLRLQWLPISTLGGFQTTCDAGNLQRSGLVPSRLTGAFGRCRCTGLMCHLAFTLRRRRHHVPTATRFFLSLPESRSCAAMALPCRKPS